jgi:hypothetical protein
MPKHVVHVGDAPVLIEVSTAGLLWCHCSMGWGCYPTAGGAVSQLAQSVGLTCCGSSLVENPGFRAAMKGAGLNSRGCAPVV